MLPNKDNFKKHINFLNKCFKKLNVLTALNNQFLNETVIAYKEY